METIVMDRSLSEEIMKRFETWTTDQHQNRQMSVGFSALVLSFFLKAKANFLVVFRFSVFGLFILLFCLKIGYNGGQLAFDEYRSIECVFRNWVVYGIL